MLHTKSAHSFKSQESFTNDTLFLHEKEKEHQMFYYMYNKTFSYQKYQSICRLSFPRMYARSYHLHLHKSENLWFGSRYSFISCRWYLTKPDYDYIMAARNILNQTYVHLISISSFKLILLEKKEFQRNKNFLKNLTRILF